MGCFASGAVFRLRNSRFVRAITGTCGSTRRSVTWPRCNSGAIATAKSLTVVAEGAVVVIDGQWSDQAPRHRHQTTRHPPRNPSLHRQRHHLFPHPVLAAGVGDAGFQLPTKIHIHGFLNVGGEKMSKSKGTFIQAATYLKHLNPAYLRYYYASKLSPRVDDLDLNPDEFVTKVNSDLVGKVVNLASRTARFVEETGLSLDVSRRRRTYLLGSRWRGDSIAEAYENCDYNRAMRQIMLLADRANQYRRRQSRRGRCAKKPPAPTSCKTSARLRSICFDNWQFTLRRCCRNSPNKPANC